MKCLALSALALAAHASGEGRTRTVLIVGASRGLGLGLARVYAEAGMRVLATARNASAAQLAALAVEHPLVSIHSLEVRDATQISSLGKALNGIALDTVIYNAGVNSGDRDGQLAINAKAPFAVLEQVLPAIRRGNVGSRRTVCIITSDLGTPVRVEAMSHVSQDVHNYALSKMAANERFRAFEPGMRALGITAIAMQPGKVKTDMNGRGNVSPLKSATSIKKVLDRLKPRQGGEFLNYKGQTISWQTGRPCSPGRCSTRAR